VLLFLTASLPVGGQSEQEYEYPLKARFMSRFIHFIAWPDLGSQYEPDTRRDFVVAVYGSSPITRHLDRLFENTVVNGRDIKVRVVDDLDRVKECSVLFLPASVGDDLDAILTETRSRPILTVGDSEGFAARGVIINFYQDGEFLRFEVNRSATDRAGLQLSSNLLRLARIVEENSTK
jgi:hypothetical protein